MFASGEKPGRLEFSGPDANSLISGDSLFLKDQGGRLLKAEGWVFAKAVGAGRSAGAKAAQRHVTFPGFDATHARGDQLGGTPRTVNLFRFSPEANRGPMNQLEGRIAEAARRGDQLYLEVYVGYDDAGQIPADVTYRVWGIDNGQLRLRTDLCATVTFAVDRFYVH